MTGAATDTIIRTHRDGGLLVISIARPQKRNALTPQMLGALRGAFHDARDARAILLAGEGDCFCAGFDMDLCRDDPTALASLLRGLAGVIAAMHACDVPVVAAVHGAAVAGGCALVAGADVAVVHDGAKLGYPVLRLGISPAVNAPALRGVMGDGPARARLLDTALISGKDAVRLGLAHESVPGREGVLSRAMEIARALAAKPPHALAATKRWLRELEGHDHDMHATRGLGASLDLVGSDETRGLLAALWSK